MVTVREFFRNQREGSVRKKVKEYDHGASKLPDLYFMHDNELLHIEQNTPQLFIGTIVKLKHNENSR